MVHSQVCFSIDRKRSLLAAKSEGKILPIHLSERSTIASHSTGCAILYIVDKIQKAIYREAKHFL